MSAKHSVKVAILNEEYTIRGDTPPDETREIAAYLDDIARQVMTGGPIVEGHRAVVLAALQVTAELFAERRASSQTTEAMSRLGDELRRLLPPAKR